MAQGRPTSPSTARSNTTPMPWPSWSGAERPRVVQPGPSRPARSCVPTSPTSFTTRCRAGRASCCRRARAAAAAARGAQLRRDVRLRDAELRGIDIRVADICVVPLPGAARGPVQVARRAQAQRCWPPRSSGRDAAAVRHPAAGRAAGVAGAGARHQAAAQLEERIRAQDPTTSPLDHKAVPWRWRRWSIR